MFPSTIFVLFFLCIKVYVWDTDKNMMNVKDDVLYMFYR